MCLHRSQKTQYTFSMHIYLIDFFFIHFLILLYSYFISSPSCFPQNKPFFFFSNRPFLWLILSFYLPDDGFCTATKIHSFCVYEKPTQDSHQSRLFMYSIFCGSLFPSLIFFFVSYGASHPQKGLGMSSKKQRKASVKRNTTCTGAKKCVNYLFLLYLAQAMNNSSILMKWMKWLFDFLKPCEFSEYAYNIKGQRCNVAVCRTLSDCTTVISLASARFKSEKHHNTTFWGKNV